MNIPSDFDPALRAATAEEYFRQGYNCCQSVALAFSDILDVPAETLSGIASGFGGGMGRLREVCGAFSGCVFMAGVMTRDSDPSVKDNRKNCYALVQEMASCFKEKNGGSIVCRELLGLGEGVRESPTPSERTAEYYKKRPCAEIVRNAAFIVAEKIISLSSR